MAEDVAPGLPKFDPKKVYLITGDTMNAIMATLRTYRPRAVTGGGLKIVSQGDDGTFLAAGGTIELTVCIGGSPVTKKFLLAE